MKQFCELVAIDESSYVRKALKENVNMTTDGLNLLFGYYNLNIPRLLKHIKVPTYLAYATFTGVDMEEQENTCKYIKKIQRNDRLPIIYRPVKSGHYAHWSDQSLLADIKGFLN
ncbi:hypothetical protein [Virgibacillus halodenitrificans]|uniref:hypothetical protein n=1 Tax=Virgibacillus halodenitrificans TaxID=1482 RepID=UPI001CB8BE52|nr:hypothetical protein [Virgibacillus halodenitrificans]